MYLLWALGRIAVFFFILYFAVQAVVLEREYEGWIEKVIVIFLAGFFAVKINFYLFGSISN